MKKIKADNELKQKVEKIHNAYKTKKRGVRKLVKEFFTEELKNHYWENMLHTNIKFERENDFGVNEYEITSMYLDCDFSEPTFLVDCEFAKSIESFTTEESVYIMLDYVKEQYGMNL